MKENISETKHLIDVAISHILAAKTPDKLAELWVMLLTLNPTIECISVLKDLVIRHVTNNPVKVEIHNLCVIYFFTKADLFEGFKAIKEDMEQPILEASSFVVRVTLKHFIEGLNATAVQNLFHELGEIDRLVKWVEKFDEDGTLCSYILHLSQKMKA